MKFSHPDRWQYGGVLIHDTWSSKEGAHVRCLLTGSIERVEQGDIVHMLQTGYGVQVVAVESPRVAV